MLSQFTVKNYKSIRDEITLDMQAATISEHEDKIIKVKLKEYEDTFECFLPVVAIYGPNGAGKSNVLEALHTLEAKILRPVCATCTNDDCGYKSKKIPVKPFVFSEKTKSRPTEFEIFFRTEIAEYKYVLHIKDEKVIFESLDRIKYETGRRSALFNRQDDVVELKGVFSRLKISDEISDTLPFLSWDYV